MSIEFPDVLRRLGLWTLVCSFSAAPSFIWAASEFNVFAMITGVAMFIAMLTAITCTQRFARFRSRPFVRRTLYIGYGARVLLSLAFPVGMLVDLYPGLLSVVLVQSMGLNERDFLGTLLATLLQGALLNAVISVFMLLLWGLQRLVCKRPPARHECARCGYDLRGHTSGAQCPECGHAGVAEPGRKAA